MVHVERLRVETDEDGYRLASITAPVALRTTAQRVHVSFHEADDTPVETDLSKVFQAAAHGYLDFIELWTQAKLGPELQGAKDWHAESVRLRQQLVWEFSEDEIPVYQQGGPGHELLSLVTAERCTQLVQHITSLQETLRQKTLEIERLKNAGSPVPAQPEEPSHPA